MEKIDVMFDGYKKDELLKRAPVCCFLSIFDGEGQGEVPNDEVCDATGDEQNY